MVHDSPAPSGDVTQLLRRAIDGEERAWDQAFQVLYDELRLLARQQLARERSGHTLQPTALVNEAYLKLVRHPPTNPDDRAHFLGLAGRAMRQILVDHARGLNAAKRGGGVRAVTLDEALAGKAADPADVLALDQALDRLDAVDPRLSKVVELRYFAGLNDSEVAAVMGVTRRSVQRYWTRARAWLHRELAARADQSGGPAARA